MSRYVKAAAGRYNLRQLPTLDRMAETWRGMGGKRLRYRDLGLRDAVRDRKDRLSDLFRRRVLDSLGEVRVNFQLRAWLLGLLDPLLVTLLPQSRTLSGPRGRGHNWSTERAYWRQTISVRMRRMWLRHEASRRGSSLSWPVCRHRSDGRRTQATPLRRWRT